MAWSTVIWAGHSHSYTYTHSNTHTHTRPTGLRPVVEGEERVRLTLCIPDQSCLRDGAFPADLRPDVLCICIEGFHIDCGIYEMIHRWCFSKYIRTGLWMWKLTSVWYLKKRRSLLRVSFKSPPLNISRPTGKHVCHCKSASTTPTK